MFPIVRLCNNGDKYFLFQAEDRPNQDVKDDWSWYYKAIGELEEEENEQDDDNDDGASYAEGFEENGTDATVEQSEENQNGTLY